MTSITLNLDEGALREATGQAIMGMLTSEMQRELIKEAIGKLLEVDSGSYGRKTSALQRAFEKAVEIRAAQVARELVEKDESLKAALDTLMVNAFNKMLKRDWDDNDFVKRVADGVIQSVSRER